VTGPDGYFGEDVAERYDDGSWEMFSAEVLEPTVDLLAELARGGRALELGIGTGRVALPLAERGVEVRGIDLSQAMVAKLRQKPGGDRVPVEIGDFASTRVDGTFTLAYLVFNTINNLTTQDAQVACFQNVADHLEPSGCFVIEVGVPGPRTFSADKRFTVFDFGDTHVGIDEYDAASQGLVSHHFSLIDGNWELLSMPFRSVWPAELDLMARLAGMSLRERWSGWKREPFTNESTKHVSVWEKDA